MPAERLDVGVRADAGFADGEASLRHQGCQTGRASEVDREVPEVAVVDADDARAGSGGVGEFGLVGHFGEDVEAELGRACGQLFVAFGREHGKHQEHGVRARRSGGEQLTFVDDEVLGQQRTVGQPSHGGETFEAAVEKTGLREHRNAVGKAAVDPCVLVQIDALPNEAERGRGAFDFQDEAAAGRSERFGKRPDGSRRPTRTFSRFGREFGQFGSPAKGFLDDRHQHRFVKGGGTQQRRMPQFGGECAGDGLHHASERERAKAR